MTAGQETLFCLEQEEKGNQSEVSQKKENGADRSDLIA